MVMTAPEADEDRLVLLPRSQPHSMVGASAGLHVMIHFGYPPMFRMVCTVSNQGRVLSSIGLDALLDEYGFAEPRTRGDH